MCYTGFRGKAEEECVKTMSNLWRLFIEKDCTLVEINPLAETHDKAVLCVDAKVTARRTTAHTIMRHTLFTLMMMVLMIYHVH